jgi:hypothetical protein
MEHEQAMEQMRAHMARRAGDRDRPPVPGDAGGERHQLTLARALANAGGSIDDAMDTIQQSLSERGGS